MTNKKTYPVRSEPKHIDNIRLFAKEIHDLNEWFEGKGIDFSNYDFNYTIEIVDKRDSSFKTDTKLMKAKYNYKFKQDETKRQGE